jgi:TonB-linked SusC/RagA family outer membrane protein
VSGKDAVIIVSYIGFLNEEVQVNDQTQINFALVQDLLSLEEIVITAYSQKTKTEISSAVVSLSAKDINQVTVNNVGDMLIGKVAGVNVQSASGQPGEESDIRIRGVGSIFSPQDPLVVVDGIIGGSYNPNDIESVSILKDAGATGLYGSRAAAGVILIQTKSGKIGKSEIRAQIKRGIKTPEFGNFEMMNTSQLYAYHKSLWSPASFETQRPASLLNNDFDWINNSYTQADITTVNVSASGANEKTNYYLSVDYMDDNGTLRSTDYKRLSVRSNVSYQLNDRVKIITNVVLNHSKHNNAHWNMAEGVFRLQPWDLPYDENGELVSDVSAAGWLSNVTANPYHSEKYNTIGGYTVNGNANFRLDIKIFDWLKLDSWTTLGADYTKYEEIYSPLTDEGASDGGLMLNDFDLNNSIGNTTLLKFDKSFGAHGIDGLVGYEVGKSRFEQEIGGEAVGFLPGQEILGVTGSQAVPVGKIIEHTNVSVLSQLNYNYNKKYFATVSYRRDGDSRFSPNSKYGSFFTYAASWLISGEDFMQQIDFIHYLKARASYGATGNATFPEDTYYPYFPSYSKVGTYNGQAPYFPENPGNYNLTWETNYQTNLGVDMGFINRIEVNFDYYDSKNKDLLFQNPMPSSQGYTSQWANVGEISNKGYEIAISAVAVQKKDITWSINFNIAGNKNKLVALSDKEGVDEMVLTRGDASQILTIDGSAFDWYMPKWLGVDPQTGEPQWEDILYDAAGNETGRQATNVYADAALDYQAAGSPFPDFSGGFGTFLSYKGFSLSAAFSYSYGNEIYNASRQELDNDGENVSVNSMVLQDGWSRWVNPGDNATHPEPIYGGNLNSNKYSSRYLEDGSYLRFRNLTLAYDLPLKYAEKIKLNSLRVSLGMDNLKTWTKYSGLDPDVPLYMTDWTLPGQQYFKYPISKQYILGLEISF